VGEISPDVVAAVLRRAAEIESAAPPSAPPLDRSVIAEIGHELGLSADAVALATGEWERGELAVVRERLPAKVLGIDAVVLIERQISRDADAVRAGTERWLDAQVFERRRHSGTGSEWVPQRGPIAQIRRATDLRRRVRLRDVDRVGLTVSARDGQAASVRVEADLGALRRGVLSCFVAVPLALGMGAGLAAVEVSPDLLAGPPVGVLVAGAGWIASRRTVERRRVEVADDLHAALDDIAAGETFPSPAGRVQVAVTDAVGTAMEAGTRAVRDAVSRWGPPRPGTRERDA
jgi:hypothetical protein